MRTLYPVALAALVVSCHLDKLLNGGGGNGPPSEAAPARVAFSSSLGNARAGQPISPPVQVTVQDSAGRVTLRDTLVTLSLAANPSGDSLRGKKQVRSVKGVASAVAGGATFPTLRIDSVGAGYPLTAAFGSAAPVDTSLPFDIIAGPPPPPPPPTHLGFTQQPRPTEAGATITPPVQVAAFDASEHVVQGFTGTIGLALEPASNGGTLSGGTPINAVNGIATFPSLSVDKASTGYTLRATASGLTDATSSAFNITPPPPTTGDLTVTTSTSGPNPPSGYTVTVDGDGIAARGIGPRSGRGHRQVTRRGWRRRDVERTARRVREPGRRRSQGVSGARFVDTQARERRDAVHCVDRRSARKRPAIGSRFQRKPDRAREPLHDVLGGIERRDLHRRRDRGPSFRGPRLLSESQVRRRRGRRRWTRDDVER